MDTGVSGQVILEFRIWVLIRKVGRPNWNPVGSGAGGWIRVATAWAGGPGIIRKGYLILPNLKLAPVCTDTSTSCQFELKRSGADR